MATKQYGPTVPSSQEIHASKYRAPFETFEDCVNRIASTLADDDDLYDNHYHVCREIMLDMRFLPAGRIQASIGSSKNITPYNCFVSSTIEDSFVDGPNSIMDVATQAAATMRMGGGIGYDFSTLRPRGDTIVKLASQTSGAVSFMSIFDAICKNVSSSGHRRGAQMGVLRVDHPDIEEFINAKHNNYNLTQFNVSIGITDKFMQAVKTGAQFDLVFGGRTYKTIDARNLWDRIMRSTWDWAEPGVLFIDTINRMNNLWYCEKISATNPCAEQPLPPNGACLLGSYNLVKYVYKVKDQFYFDYHKFRKDIHAITRMMDNVVDVATYPLETQRIEAKSKRRMGMGITGLANTLELLGYRYGSSDAVKITSDILSVLTHTSYQASVEIATQKGPFPLFDANAYCESEFIKSVLPKALIEDIRENGIRNSHLTSIAPTGTISLAADNVSSGIEPVFSHEYERQVIEFGGATTKVYKDYVYNFYGIKGVTASDVSIDEHLNMLIIAQKYMDSSVSKTCNVPSDIPWEDFKQVYFRAWEEGCKGCTTYRVGGMRNAVLVEKEDQQENLACVINEDGTRSCDE